MNAPTKRPLSPHLSIYRWQPHMLVSILHRVTGSALTVAGLAILTWWMVALASGNEAYADFQAIVGSPVGLVVLVGLTWAFWQHFASGMRHLVLDMGAGFELKTNRFWSIMTIVISLALTAITWVLLGVLS